MHQILILESSRVSNPPRKITLLLAWYLNTMNDLQIQGQNDCDFDIKLEGQANPNLCIKEYFVAAYKYVLEVWINMNIYISDVLLDSLPHSVQRKA